MPPEGRAVSPPPDLHRFVEDELMRAPLLAEQVIEGAIDDIRRSNPAMSPRERAVSADLQRALLSQRPALVGGFVRALREAALRELDGADTAAASLPTGPGALSLVDEGEVEVDVEISRAIEAIRSEAEQELRDIMSYTSALVGDMDVARDYNPFRPEIFARALWAGAQCLSLPTAYQLALMRHACTPLAQLVRKAYAGACARLESQGIEPAVYRTIIVYGAGRRAGAAPEASAEARSAAVDIPLATAAGSAADTLDQILRRADDVMRRLPPDGDRLQREQLRQLQQRQLVASAARADERQTIELLSRLFDVVLGDRRLAPDIQNLVSRLQPPALRAALRDPGTLDDPGHAIWQLMDRVAMQGDLHPPAGDPERARMLRFVHGVLDSLTQEQAREAAAFRWAEDRIRAYERHRFEQRRQAAADEIRSLEDLEARDAATSGPPSTTHGALDVGQLDTVPAELLDEPLPAGTAAPTGGSEGLESLRAGEWVRLFMQGGWVHAQLLWRGEHQEYWLFADGASPRTWAVRRRALERLQSHQLLGWLHPRSLIADAAERVRRGMARRGSPA